MMGENASEQQIKQLRIQVDKQKGKIILHNIQLQLTYLVLSTQPGRKIIYPPIQIDQQNRILVFSYKKCDGIVQDAQSFCAVGFENFMNSAKQKSIIKLNKQQSIKSLYISKITTVFKPLSNTYFIDQNQKYRFTLSTLPPKDINASQIQQFLQKIDQSYGKNFKIDVKRNCLIIDFEQEIKIKQNFIIKGIKTNQNGDNILVYWVFTNHRTLFTFQPVSLIQLPIKQKIKHISIQSEWIILIAQNDVIFLHLYRPTEHFTTLHGMSVQALVNFEQDKIMIFQYKFMHIYQLYTYKNPHLLGKAKIKKMQAYTAAFNKKTGLFAGINYSSMLNQRQKQKQIYVIQNFTTSNLNYKSFIADKKLSICKKNEQVPILNLNYLPKINLFICSCAESIYLIHLQSSSLIASVDLKSQVCSIFQIDYPINIANFIIRVKDEKSLIRVGFQQNGPIVGTQITNLSKFQNCVDFCAFSKQVYWTDGSLIVHSNYQKTAVLFSCETDEIIKKIAIFNDFFAFLLVKKNVLEAYFLQL